MCSSFGSLGPGTPRGSTVLERLELDVIESAPGTLMDQLGLVQAVERFGERVVV